MSAPDLEIAFNNKQYVFEYNCFSDFSFDGSAFVLNQAADHKLLRSRFGHKTSYNIVNVEETALLETVQIGVVCPFVALASRGCQT